MNDEESIREFEHWAYATDSLEALLDEDYFNLISLDFSRRDSRYEAIKILERHTNMGEYATWKLSKLLSLFISQEGDSLSLLREFYKLYCNGLYFLDRLGYEYGLATIVPPSGYRSYDWDELTDQEKEKLLSSVLPEAIAEAQTILTWLNDGKIVITDKQDELPHYLYVDRRCEEKKNSNLQGWKQGLNTLPKFWWQFWRR